MSGVYFRYQGKSLVLIYLNEMQMSYVKRVYSDNKEYNWYWFNWTQCRPLHKRASLRSVSNLCMEVKEFGPQNNRAPAPPPPDQNLRDSDYVMARSHQKYLTSDGHQMAIGQNRFLYNTLWHSHTSVAERMENGSTEDRVCHINKEKYIT